jgi:hypothetical protein
MRLPKTSLRPYNPSIIIWDEQVMATTLPTERMDGRRLIAVFMIAIACVAGFLAISWSKEILTARQAMAWPTAQGTVLISKTDTCAKRAGFAPDVRYTYSVDGHIYEGYRIAFGPLSCGSELRAQSIAARYPAGHITVWFDPHKPGEAALMVGDVMHETRSSIYWSTAVCVASLLLTTWCLRAAARTEQRWKEQGL